MLRTFQMTLVYTETWLFLVFPCSGFLKETSQTRNCVLYKIKEATHGTLIQRFKRGRASEKYLMRPRTFRKELKYNARVVHKYMYSLFYEFNISQLLFKLVDTLICMRSNYRERLPP